MLNIFGNANYTKADIAGIVLVATIWGERLLYYVRSVLLRLPIIGNFAEPFIVVTIVAVIIITLRWVKDRIRLQDLLFVFVVLSVYLLHLAIYEENAEYLSENFPHFITVCLPMYLLGVVCDIDKCINVLVKVSLAYVFLGVLYYYYVTFVVGTYEMDATVDQMGLAYQYLPHVLLLIYATIKKFNVWYFAGILLGVFMILGSGNRGSLLLVFVFTAVVFLFWSKGNIFVKTLTLPLFLILIISSDSIAIFFSDIMDDFGLSARSLNYFLEGEIADDNGRSRISKILVSAIWNSPIIGYGLAGDRIFLDDLYSHNLLLELLMSFGIPVGFAVFAAICLLLVRSFYKCQTSVQKAFYFVLLCCGFLQLFLSNTFLFEKTFYFLLGYCVMILRTYDNYLSKEVSNEESEYALHSSDSTVASCVMPEQR